jgi:thymidylate kinase
MILEIDGNDGVGKTTLVKRLRILYPHRVIRDRGDMTRATDDPSVDPSPDTVYILLDAPVMVSRRRLIKADQDLSEPYHTTPDLLYYRIRFLEVADRFDAHVIDASVTPYQVLDRVRQHFNL